MVAPIVRYMIVCRDWFSDSDDPAQANIKSIVNTVRPLSDEKFPIVIDQIAVVLILSSVRGKGTAQIVVVDDETDHPAFGSSPHPMESRNTPLDVRTSVFKIQDCIIRRPGMYRVQFRYNDTVVEEKYLQIREER